MVKTSFAAGAATVMMLELARSVSVPLELWSLYTASKSYMVPVVAPLHCQDTPFCGETLFCATWNAFPDPVTRWKMTIRVFCWDAPLKLIVPEIATAAGCGVGVLAAGVGVTGGWAV